jgi:hypothetical protein
MGSVPKLTEEAEDAAPTVPANAADSLDFDVSSEIPRCSPAALPGTLAGTVDQNDMALSILTQATGSTGTTVDAPPRQTIDSGAPPKEPPDPNKSEADQYPELEYDHIQALSALLSQALIAETSSYVWLMAQAATLWWEVSRHVLTGNISF